MSLTNDVVSLTYGPWPSLAYSPQCLFIFSFSMYLEMKLVTACSATVQGRKFKFCVGNDVDLLYFGNEFSSAPFCYSQCLFTFLSFHKCIIFFVVDFLANCHVRKFIESSYLAQSTLVISTLIISNNRLARRKNLVLV